ncbi:MAG: DUF5723 family protein [Bacteroidales bacterium]
MSLLRKALILCLSSLPLILPAQYNALLLQSPEHAVYAAQGAIHSGSNALTNKDFFRLRQGGHLSAEEISELDDMLRNENIIGGYYSYDLLSISPWKRESNPKDTLFLVGNLGYHQYQEANIPKAAAKLALHGNLQFEGMTVQLSPLHYQMQKYYQFKVGLMKVTTGSKGKFYAGFTAGISLGLQQMNIHVEEASLYTAPFGEFLTLQSMIHFSRSAPEPFSPFGIHGTGPALDFFYAWLPRGKGPQLAVSFTQLGFIMWDKNSYSYHRDTTIRFEGVVVDNLFNMGDTWDDNLSLDTLDGLFHRVGTPHRHYTSLPLSVHFSLRQQLPGTPISLRGELTYRHQTLMLPYIELALDWKAWKKLELGRSLYFGGYNGVSGGWMVKYLPVPGWTIQLASHDLYQTASSNSKVSLQILAGVSYRPKIRTSSR